MLGPPLRQQLADYLPQSIDERGRPKVRVGRGELARLRLVPSIREQLAERSSQGFAIEASRAHRGAVLLDTYRSELLLDGQGHEQERLSGEEEAYGRGVARVEDRAIGGPGHAVEREEAVGHAKPTSRPLAALVLREGVDDDK